MTSYVVLYNLSVNKVMFCSVLFLLNVFGVGVSCRNLYSFVVYLYVNCSGSITCCLPVIMWFLFGEVSSSSGCFGWATLFYCCTP